VGKTTLAQQLAAQETTPYLDLESPGDVAKLLILDEVQRQPELFGTLRGRFLLLGSASVELIRQSSESLAGRLAFVELGGLTVPEAGEALGEQLWIRGGFPDSFLASSDQASSLGVSGKSVARYLDLLVDLLLGLDDREAVLGHRVAELAN
jgi:predicted AAA+ superfamily ATPase